MGQEILYCFKCQKRVVGADFAKGLAYQVGNNTSCSTCAVALLQTLNEHDREALMAKMFKSTQGRQKSSSAAHVALPDRRKTTTASIPILHAPRSAPPEAQGNGLVIGIGVAVAAVVVIGIVASQSGSEPAPLPAKAPVVHRPGPPPEDPAARAAIARARAERGDLNAQIQAWEAAVTAAEKTPLYEEARRHLGDLLLRRKDAVTRDLAELDTAARRSAATEDFKAAVDLYQSAKHRHDVPEWNLQLDQKVRDVREAAAQLYRPAREKAEAARKRGADPEVQAFRERVLKWGIPELVADLETFPPPPPPVEERPWKPVLGPGLESLRGKGGGGWLFEGSVLVKNTKHDAACQTQRQFEDGELRVLFEIRSGSNFWFSMRQGSGESPFHVWMNIQALKAIGYGQHEILFVCQGDSVVATLDGKPLKLTDGKARKGVLQFNASPEADFRILSIDYRPLK